MLHETGGGNDWGGFAVGQECLTRRGGDGGDARLAAGVGRGLIGQILKQKKKGCPDGQPGGN